MTVFDRFFSFANSLPADQRESVEAALAALMDSLSDQYGFTATELAELDRRVAEPKPAYASPAAVTRIFGKPFSA